MLQIYIFILIKNTKSQKEAVSKVNHTCFVFSFRKIIFQK